MSPREPSARKPKFDLDAFLVKIGGSQTSTLYKKGQVIFSQGDEADAVYYIQKGSVKVTVVSRLGKEAVVAILAANDFFGEGCLAGQKRRISSVQTTGECRIVKFARHAIAELIRDQPKFSEAFMAYLLSRTLRVEADLLDQLFNSSEKRLARLLLLLVNFGQGDNSQPKSTKITQETLAEMIGTTRSRVSFFMNKFRKLGFIDYNGHIVVHNSLLNVVLHDRPHITGDRGRGPSDKNIL